MDFFTIFSYQILEHYAPEKVRDIFGPWQWWLGLIRPRSLLLSLAVSQILADCTACDWRRFCKALCNVKFSQIEDDNRKFRHMELSNIALSVKFSNSVASKRKQFFNFKISSNCIISYETFYSVENTCKFSYFDNQFYDFWRPPSLHTLHTSSDIIHWRFKLMDGL